MKQENEILASDIWNEAKTAGLREFIITKSEEQSEERKLRNELLAIQYQMEDYINNDMPATRLSLLDFVKMYLKVLNLPLKKLAELFEMKDSNLHKYLTGERRLNTTLALKLSSFTRTDPEYWYRIEVRNELMELKKEKEHTLAYQKYDYQNLLVTT